MFELAPIGGVGWQSFCTWREQMTQRVPITIGTRSVILICERLSIYHPAQAG